MYKKIKLFIVIAIIASLIIGCSQNGVNDVSTEDKNNQKENIKSEEDMEYGSNNGEEADNESEPASSYTYVDAAGREVILENEPVKIVTTYLPLWETLLMLDVTPIGAGGAENYTATWDPFEDMDLSEVIDIGSTEVNLELLAELEPDLILDQAYNLNSVDVENLEKIAPVAVYGPETKVDWRLSLREVGKAINKEDKAEEVIKEVDEKLRESREKLEENYNGKTVMMISMMGADKYYCIYRPDLYDDETGLGLNAPKGFPESENYVQVSMEALVEMNPDYIFVNVFDGDEAIYEELSQNTVWKSLKAVKEDHVFRLDGSGHACSALSTVYTVDKIVETLLAEK
ncbi:iron-siderophore ABC transporter substrate-binding protein [Sporosalibacterium faouarense]|uniref:iron-siderophore ABC transporter substrate-binding protein n=1 Tax=Sporosalibacterium faouarense TaxID=516123 RepID=UPI00192BEDF6|nr:ABC transporter substrate-binding protein [Sporosalibacterium faouarense]